MLILLLSLNDICKVLAVGLRWRYVRIYDLNNVISEKSG